MSPEQINLLISIVLSFNTIVIVPLFAVVVYMVKFMVYVHKEVSYIKGHLNIK
jgi:hypothetical protein